jgi:hypothetical protein
MEVIVGVGDKCHFTMCLSKIRRNKGWCALRTHPGYWQVYDDGRGLCTLVIHGWNCTVEALCPRA